MNEFEGSGDGCLEVMRDESGYASLIARTGFVKGAVIDQFSAREVVAQPNYLTVQTGPDRHILLDPEYLQYINHSCEPNVFFDTEAGTVDALSDIAVGEPLTFFYPSTEWTMDRAFDCHCGTASCLGQITGASQLPGEVLNRYRLSSHINDASEQTRVEQSA